MNKQEIQSFCIQGTEAYLDFLNSNNRGLDVIPVRLIEQVAHGEKPVFKLVLQRRLFDPDSVFIKLTPPNRDFGTNDFRVREYDADAKTLIVEIQTQSLDLSRRPAGEVTVVSDLRFLVRNVKQWFASNGLTLHLPQQHQNKSSATVVYSKAQTNLPLNSCQIDAIGTSLDNQLTYVWGQPGTGKTKHVLAGAVVELLLAGKKVGVYAPTNNALDQAMTAVIAAAEKFDLGRENFLRVGSPSPRFAKDFPEVCEIQGLDKRIGELTRQIQIYEKVLNWRRGATVLHSTDSLLHEISVLRRLLDRRREVCGLLGTNLLEKVIAILKGRRQALEKELADLEKQIHNLLETIRRTQTESEKLNEIIRQASFANIDQTQNEISCLEVEAKRYRDTNAAIAREYEKQSDEEIKALRTGLEKQKEQLKTQSVDERIKTASVVGMTLDRHIGWFANQFIEFDHVFLDEAGYAPAVKALTLCRGNVPLTFIGDHKQLGPVCEMSDKQFTLDKNHPAVVWKKSALFIDDFFAADSIGALIAEWLSLFEPRLRLFKGARLNSTFRFGQNLADILSECVYSGIEFTSSAPHENLKIVCLDTTPGTPPAEQRENQAEVDAIRDYLQRHPESGNDREESYVILAPYKKQISLLSRYLENARREDRIMTVHKSQGREWDTVILSVVDGRHNKPWFTDTTNSESGGLHVMNTAISRARKNLILVCDTQFWRNNPDAAQQLISRLIAGR